jgi:DNA-binding transcriptional MerR regulator
MRRNEGYLRGELAKLANVNAETLRYYEQQGIIPAPVRTEAGYRLYPEETLSRLAFVRNAKSCGFTLKEIKKALAGQAAGKLDVAAFVAAIDGKTAALNEEIASRERMKARLAALRANLEAAQRHPEVESTLRILRIP